MITPIVPAQPSEKSRELSRRLSEVIHEYRKEQAGVKDEEIQQAFRLAAMETGTGKNKDKMAIMGIILFLVILGLFLFTRLGVR